MESDQTCNNLGNKGTVVDILKMRSREEPDKIAFKYLIYAGKNRSEKNITYGALDRQASKMAVFLQQHDISGKCVVLLYPGGLDFIIAFYGCLYAKAIAVPLFHFLSRRKSERITDIIRDSGAEIFLSDSANIDNVSAFVNNHFPGCDYKWAATDQLLTGNSIDENDLSEIALTGEDLAYLQYTSGSTSLPKGVMITHRNILHNVGIIRWYLNHTPDSVGVSWLIFWGGTVIMNWGEYPPMRILNSRPPLIWSG